MSLTYDPVALRAALTSLPHRFKTAFAAACAQRQMNAFRDFTELTGEGDPNSLETILDSVWHNLDGSGIDTALHDAELAYCLALIPSEEDRPWSVHISYAERAARAVCYALRTRGSDDPQDAAWAAHMAWDALYWFVVWRDNLDVNAVTVDELCTDPLIQAELVRQRDDLEMLMNARRSVSAEVVGMLRRQARDDANIFFGSRI